MNEPLLAFDITKRFPTFSLECGADFEHGVTAIFGPSGSGKTVLLNCIAGLTEPDEGEIRVSGRRIFSSSERLNTPPERRRFGYVFQDSALFPHMSVRDNIMYGYNLTPAQHRVTEPAQLVELFRLSPLMDRPITNLSGGERQRVALARALATSPDLLLLDEPLASLDMAFRGTIIRFLKQVSRDLKTPMIYVSHSISEVMALAANVLVLSGGRSIVHGRTSQALAHPGVSHIADYATLENLLEAEVVSSDSSGGITELRVGDVRLLAPHVSGTPGDSVMISVRAGDIIVSQDAVTGISARNVVPAAIEEINILDARVLIYADVGLRVVAEITPAALTELALRKGQRIYLIIKTNSIMVLEAPPSE